jgi:hypothetical protein
LFIYVYLFLYIVYVFVDLFIVICLFVYGLFVFDQAYNLTVRNTLIADSNSAETVNGRGVMSLTCGSGSRVVLESISVTNVSLSSTTNGSISLHGTVGLLSVDNAYFSNIGTGNCGGAMFINVSSFTDSSDSVIQNTLVEFCGAVYGGGLYIAKAGVRIYNVNFSNNTATTAGVDMYENQTVDNSFYDSSKLEACCSLSEGEYLFALRDDGNKSDLLPICIPPEGERYISSASGSDTQNTCLSPDMPCESLANAILSGQASLQAAISVMVIGEYEGADTNIPVAEVVFIRSFGDSPSVIAFLSLFLFYLGILCL